MDNSNPDKTTTDTEGQRGPVFSKDEVKLLLSLVKKYKAVLLNKSVDSASNHAKDIAWVKIAKQFNEQNINNRRSVDNLRTKWENLKKLARRVSKRVMDVNYTELDEITAQVVAMLHETVNSIELLESVQSFEEQNDYENGIKESSGKFWNDDKSSDESGSAGEIDRRARSLNFSPKECDLLLKCVKEEKEIIMNVATTKKANDLKHSAWSRVTEKFNKYNSIVRSKRVLRTKFENMKKVMKKASLEEYVRRFGEEQLENRTFKTEPLFDNKIDDQVLDEVDPSDHRDSPFQNNDDCIDPLRFVMNTDIGIGSFSNMTPWNDFENKEVVKLKMELLNYQLETAKLKRKRLEDAIRAEAAEAEAKALETSLRLRTARLEAVAAEMKLPQSHPALAYTDRESLAQEFLKNQ